MFARRLLALILTAGVASAGAEELRRLPPVHSADFQPKTLVDTVGGPDAEPCGCYPCGTAWSDYKLDFVFDKGFGIVSTEPKRRPNSLYIGARMQHRYSGFTRDETSYTDNAGTTRQIRNRNEFDFERVRINLQGTVLDPRLKYNLSFDGDSDGRSQVDMLFYFFQYDACDALKIRLGRWRTLYGREWLLSSRYLRMVDRSMVTDFFRPGFSDGVWLIGDLPDGFHYEFGLTNGLATSTRTPASLDDNLDVSGTLRWDPWGPFGKGFQDFGMHENPVVRLGCSGVLSKSDDRSDIGFPLGDDGGVLRLADGTLLSDIGALAPGVQVTGVTTLQASCDAAIKWRGWSVGGEYFVRSLQDFNATGALPVSQITQHGWRGEGGVFLVPRRLGVNFQATEVAGDFGRGFTYGVGFNYYLRGGDDRLNKVSLDVTDVTRSPTTRSTSDLIAGDDGQMVRLQVQLGF